MNLTIDLSEEYLQALTVKATVLGVSPEQYLFRLIEEDLAPAWLRESWASAKELGLDQLSMEEIDQEIAAARKARREAIPQLGA